MYTIFLSGFNWLYIHLRLHSMYCCSIFCVDKYLCCHSRRLCMLELVHTPQAKRRSMNRCLTSSRFVLVWASGFVKSQKQLSSTWSSTHNSGNSNVAIGMTVRSISLGRRAAFVIARRSHAHALMDRLHEAGPARPVPTPSEASAYPLPQS
jgi:hypothetical protein